MKTYYELFVELETAMELVAELKEDDAVHNIELIKTGDGYAVQWQEQ